MSYFQNRPLIRLQNWDYGNPAAYFVTICTYERTHYFGGIIEGKMNLSPSGIIADILWYEIKNHSKDVKLGPFVVMPDHIHGILIFNKYHPNTSINNETGKEQRFQNIGKNTLSSIVGGYKSAVTKHIRRLGFEFGWQPRFYEHIIRDDDAFKRIEKYIMDNPKNWKN